MKNYEFKGLVTFRVIDFIAMLYPYIHVQMKYCKVDFFFHFDMFFYHVLKFSYVIPNLNMRADNVFYYLISRCCNNNLFHVN